MVPPQRHICVLSGSEDNIGTGTEAHNYTLSGGCKSSVPLEDLV